MASMKLPIEYIDIKRNFNLWQVKRKALNIQYGVHKALNVNFKMLSGITSARYGMKLIKRL